VLQSAHVTEATLALCEVALVCVGHFALRAPGKPAVFARGAQFDRLVLNATPAVLSAAAAEGGGGVALVADEILAPSTVGEGVLLAVLFLAPATKRCVAARAHKSVLLIIVLTLRTYCLLTSQTPANHCTLAVWISGVRPTTNNERAPAAFHTNHFARAGREVCGHRILTFALHCQPLEQLTAVVLEAAQGSGNFVIADDVDFR
jgi:hypothetical protein